jgi:hypothetical protein
VSEVEIRCAILSGAKAPYPAHINAPPQGNLPKGSKVPHPIRHCWGGAVVFAVVCDLAFAFALVFNLETLKL